jgi:fumarate reductase subunit D
MTIYEKSWHRLKHFPTSLAKGSNHSPPTSGSAAAALISVGIACFMMMVSHHLAETSTVIDTFIWGLGKWIPGSNTGNKVWGMIGSYTGKETILLISWLVSWFIFHNLLKHKQIKTMTMFLWTFGLIVAATVMTWQPLFIYLPLT